MDFVWLGMIALASLGALYLLSSRQARRRDGDRGGGASDSVGMDGGCDTGSCDGGGGDGGGGD